MAHIVTTPEAGVLHRIGAAFTAALDALAKARIASVSAEARFNEVQRLQALSDAELAEMGIARDRIVHHVFRDIYMI